MTKLRADQLANAMTKNIAPLYLVSGDEPLLIQEACDIIRRRAKDTGYLERELYHTDSGFDWDNLAHSTNSLSLFSDRKIIEIRVHSGKVGDAGSKAIVEYCENANEDTLLLLIFPKLDKRTQNSKWFKAAAKHGDIIAVWPISIQQLPHWVSQRMRAAELHADNEAIEILCVKVEGNLLAAAQEIEKLKLIAEDNHIDAKIMADTVTDSARYDVFSLVDKALAGDWQAATACLHGLRAEGTEPTLILWALSREIRALTTIKESIENGKSFDFAAKQMSVWENRKAKIKHATHRLQLKQLYILIRKSGNLDKMIKGTIRADVWNMLLDLVLSLSGRETLAPRSLKINLQTSR